jgi:hypothetical protein
MALAVTQKSEQVHEWFLKTNYYLNGAWIQLPSRRWNSRSLVLDASNLLAQAPLKWSALPRMSLVVSSTDPGGRSSSITPEVAFSTYELTRPPTCAA